MKHGQRFTYEQLDAMSKHQVINTALRLQQQVVVRNQIINSLRSQVNWDKHPVKGGVDIINPESVDDRSNEA